MSGKSHTSFMGEKENSDYSMMAWQIRFNHNVENL